MTHSNTWSQLCQSASLANLSQHFNGWFVRIGTDVFGITPAHNTIYSNSKTNKWQKSKFLSEYADKEWFIHPEYLVKGTPELDFAWFRVDDPTDMEQPPLDVADDITSPEPCDVFFRQPYDKDGVWSTNPSFASLHTTIYPSPNSSLLEAIDVGFRGLSGAISLNNQSQVNGLLLRRAKAILPKSLRANTNNLNDTEKKDDIPKLSPELTVIQQQLDNITNNMLTVKHVDELFSIIGLRRSLLLPPSTMQELISSNSVCIDSVVGRPAKQEFLINLPDEY